MALAPGAPERLQLLNWRILGAGTALPRRGLSGELYGPCSIALSSTSSAKVLLLDCGPGTIRSLSAYGIQLEQIRRVLITHEHADHVLDVLALLFARRNPRLAGCEELELHGPAGVFGPLLEAGQILGALGRDGFAGAGARLYEWSAPELERGVRIGDLLVRGLDTGHTTLAKAYRIEAAGGQVFAFSGDAEENDAVVEIARAADLFVCECATADNDPLRGHLQPSGVIRIVQAAEPRRVLLTHVYPGLDPAEAARQVEAATRIPTRAAQDGLAGQLGERA